VNENLNVVYGDDMVDAGPDESGSVGGGQLTGPESCPGAARRGEAVEAETAPVVPGEVVAAEFRSENGRYRP
jgi:hypothetical protein